jgi:hypothetical protein
MLLRNAAGLVRNRSTGTIVVIIVHSYYGQLNKATSFFPAQVNTVIPHPVPKLEVNTEFGDDGLEISTFPGHTVFGSFQSLVTGV